MQHCARYSIQIFTIARRALNYVEIRKLAISQAHRFRRETLRTMKS